MSVLLNKQRHRRHESVEKFRNLLVVPLRVFQVSRARVFRSLICLSSKLGITHSQQRSGTPYTRRIFARGVVDWTYCTRIFKSHYIHVDINFPLFSLPLCCCWFLRMASCVETFEMEVMHLCLFTFIDIIVVFHLIWKILRIEIVKYEASHQHCVLAW